MDEDCACVCHGLIHETHARMEQTREKLGRIAMTNRERQAERLWAFLNERLFLLVSEPYFKLERVFEIFSASGKREMAFWN